MGILDIAEEAAGAFAADKALEAVDPNAGLLAKAAAAVAGFEGVGAIKEHLEGSEDKPADEAATNAYFVTMCYSRKQSSLSTPPPRVRL